MCFFYFPIFRSLHSFFKATMGFHLWHCFAFLSRTKAVWHLMISMISFCSLPFLKSNPSVLRMKPLAIIRSNALFDRFSFFAAKNMRKPFYRFPHTWWTWRDLRHERSVRESGAYRQIWFGMGERKSRFPRTDTEFWNRKLNRYDPSDARSFKQFTYFFETDIGAQRIIFLIR